MSDKIYPIGIQNFEKLRKEGYFYIDKTALIYKMVKTGQLLLPQSSAPFREKSAGFYSGSLFPRQERII